MVELHQVVDYMRQWTKEVGSYQLQKLEQGFEYTTKTTDTDIVTEVDKWSDCYFVENIRKAYPEHTILSEEEGLINEGNTYQWIVDPLDGTNNYLHGYPMHCISIALEKDGESLAGAIYIPRLDEFFYAIKGEGAYLNTRKIQVAKNTLLNQCVIATGFPYDKHLSVHSNINLSSHMIPLLQGVRRSGSAAIDLCFTACGRLDGYWELKLSPWDLAAGKLIVKEAGGIVETSTLVKESGETGINIIAGNKEIVYKLKKEIQSIYSYFD